MKSSKIFTHIFIFSSHLKIYKVMGKSTCAKDELLKRNRFPIVKKVRNIHQYVNSFDTYTNFLSKQGICTFPDLSVFFFQV